MCERNPTCCYIMYGWTCLERASFLSIWFTTLSLVPREPCLPLGRWSAAVHLAVLKLGSEVLLWRGWYAFSDGGQGRFPGGGESWVGFWWVNRSFPRHTEEVEWEGRGVFQAEARKGKTSLLLWGFLRLGLWWIWWRIAMDGSCQRIRKVPYCSSPSFPPSLYVCLSVLPTSLVMWGSCALVWNPIQNRVASAPSGLL